jgi:hypothetical protein
MIVIIIVFVVVWAAFYLVVLMRGSKGRKPQDDYDASVPPLNLPPFGTLRRSKYGWWEGEARLPAWAGFQSRRGAYGSLDSRSPSDGSVEVHVNSKTDCPPSEAQRKALQFQLEHGAEVRQSALDALLRHYHEIRDECMEELVLTDEEMPPIQSTEQFRRLIGLHTVHIRPFEKEGMAYVGLEFGCTWEDEHGLGILVHGARVVEIGAADTAFDEIPAEVESA